MACIELGELKTATFWRDVVTEIICTFLLLMIIGFQMVTLDTNVYVGNSLHSALVLTLTVPTLTQAFFYISGTYMNPGVVFTTFIKGRMTFVRFLLFSGADLLGAFAGVSTCISLTPEEKRSSIKVLKPNALLSDGQALAVEILATTLLYYSVLMMTDSTGKHGKVTAYGTMVPHFAISVGFCVGAGILATITWVQASFNPAVPFGFASAKRDWEKHWIFWVAPYVAGVVAASMHTLLTYTRPKPKPITQSMETQVDTTELSVNPSA